MSSHYFNLFRTVKTIQQIESKSEDKYYVLRTILDKDKQQFESDQCKDKVDIVVAPGWWTCLC